jgi:hypothetical protein
MVRVCTSTLKIVPALLFNWLLLLSFICHKGDSQPLATMVVLSVSGNVSNGWTSRSCKDHLEQWTNTCTFFATFFLHVYRRIRTVKKVLL